MIFLIVVANGYVLVTLIGVYAKNHNFCFPLIYFLALGLRFWNDTFLVEISFCGYALINLT